ncbi:MAG: glycoside hydrolase family 127 protein [Kordiimonadaceae bacterium]|nr:glycoside hydrolase family 127 protein [Kordiimonadaceae bacterium]MBT6033178.1 glycoside hydrolase family 127 protein [Kordiimonadaceae bacterium]
MERRDFLKVSGIGVATFIFPVMGNPLIAQEMQKFNILPLHGLREVSHENVKLDGGFWGKRQDNHHHVTIPHVLDQLDKTGHMTNFDTASGASNGPFSANLDGNHAYDSDLYKALEGVLYSLTHYENKELSARVDNIINRITAAQQDDGFLISYFIGSKENERWDDIRLNHQTYNAGHLFEMAVEHKRLTGNDTTINAAKKFADHIDRRFGPDKLYDVGGHEEIELALVKLYRSTGDTKYLDLCRFFLDERGHAHGTERKPFTMVPKEVPVRTPGQSDAEFKRVELFAKLRWRNGRMQDHKPLIEQDAIGHAVRAGYIYSAMADISRFSDAPEYEKAVEHIWNDVVFRKLYITGGIGTAQYGDEGFGDPYLLPNDTYCESCASIAHVFWQHRMNLLKGKAKYADVMELALYNGAISGISLEGNTFFYENPLQSSGTSRVPWIETACCPTNLTRIIPQVGGFQYAQNEGNIYVNLYAAGKAQIEIENNLTITLSQKTDYPWDGIIQLTVNPESPSVFTLFVRIPGWAKGNPVPSDLYHFAKAEINPFTLKINGESVNTTANNDGYVELDREWQKEDVIELNLPMPVSRVYANEKIEADIGKISLMRGPIVYCLEEADNPDLDFAKFELQPNTELRAYHRQDLLGGVTVIEGNADQQKITAIPYYAWANRSEGSMTVWFDEGEV